MSTQLTSAGSAPGPPETASAPGVFGRVVRNPLAVGCLCYLGVLVLVAVVAPVLLPHVAAEHAGDLLAVRQGPSAEHLLGTDTLGRDVLQRLLVGTRPTLLGVAQAVLVVLALGVPLGLVAGYLGGWFDRVVSWLGDLVFAMPAIVIVLVVLAVFPQSMTAAMITLGVIAAPSLMRIVRSATLPVREELYVAAAKVSGLPDLYIMARHVLPRIAGAIIVQASLLAGVALLVQTGLGFLNLVVAAPAPSWGGMVADGMSAIELQPWLIMPPGAVIAVTVLALGLFGDALRDATTQQWAAAPAGSGDRRRSAEAGARQAQLPVSPADGGSSAGLLAIDGLRVTFPLPTGEASVVDDVSMTVGPGETVGVVGESGCGKTTVAMAIMGLLPGNGRIAAGHVWFEGRDIAGRSERELAAVRGRRIGLISQEPMVSMNPAFRVGWQLAEAVRRHHGIGRAEARRRVIDLLGQVHLPAPETVARKYPHELSGGMAQRVAIARALAGEPRLLIADEPTTALDVTVQADILSLLRNLQAERGMAILLVTHDWGVVAELCDRAMVMYAGQIVEHGGVDDLFRTSAHPYTEALMAANPHHASDADVLPAIPGTVPRPGHWPAGCHFGPRCAYVADDCGDRPIPLAELSPGRSTRCLRHELLGTRVNR